MLVKVTGARSSSGASKVPTAEAAVAVSAARKRPTSSVVSSASSWSYHFPSVTGQTANSTASSHAAASATAAFAAAAAAAAAGAAAGTGLETTNEERWP